MVHHNSKNLKPPPAVPESERIVLGSAIRDPERAAAILAAVSEVDLSQDAHVRVRRAVEHIIRAGGVPDLAAVHHHLDATRQLADVGSVAYLADLHAAAGPGASWEYHARLVRETSARRRLLRAAEKIAHDAHDMPPAALAARLDADLATIRGGTEPASTPRWPEPQPVTALSADGSIIPWIWTGYLARGHTTLFSALSKAGKTTLLAHLLRSLQYGMRFLEREVAESRTLVVAEESEAIWAIRRDDLLLDDHLHVLSRPLRAKPSMREFEEFMVFVADRATRLNCSLVVIDTLSKFAPWKNENDNSEVQQVMNALDVITTAGPAVLVNHHAGKADMGEGRNARGGSAITGAVDIILELRRFDAADRTDRRRVITGYGRFDEIPDEVVIALAEDGSDYTAEGDRRGIHARKWTDEALRLLPRDEPGRTAAEVWEDMGDGRPKRADVMKLLQGAVSAGRCRRTGSGRPPRDPYRFVA